MRNLKQRLFSLLLCAAMLFSLCAPAAAAEDTVEESPQTVTNVPYRDEKGETTNCAEAITVTADKTTWGETDGRPHWYVAEGLVPVMIGSRVNVRGDVHLILANGCDLTVDGGIDVGQGNSLTVYAQSTDERTMGKLTATSTYGAGIGSGERKAGGTITINGGTVTASSTSGAGIGGGASGAGGEITINGGTVKASSYSGAGIGGGNYGNGGTITINGGEVTATSEENGAGIGGGGSKDGDVIIITGGEVTATSKGDGAGIGGGISGGGGTIKIDGGAVSATSNIDGAGIGGGDDGHGDEITITGGTVTATSKSDGAGIGGGAGGDGGTITISGGTVTASSDNWGAGIGGGSGGENVGGAGGEITISGGTVTASSAECGAGIGGGGSTETGGPGGEIKISGGTVTATSGAMGVGIGGGGTNNGFEGNSGTFITGPNGSAFIVANGISDQSGKDDGSWSGVIFEGRNGKVYNSPITLATDATISKDTTLEIEEGQTLIVGAGVTLTNNGTITGSGTIKGKVINNGTIEDGITVQDHTHQWDTAWSSDATNHWHRCTVTGCGERSDTAAHTPGNWIVDRAASSTEAGQRHKACTVCGYVTATETIPATGGGGGGGGGYIPLPSTPTYPPTVERPSGGGGEAPAVSPSNPKQGDTVTVTPKPGDGCEVDTITVTDRDGKPVEVTKKPDGSYTFQQPSGKVTIKVTYRPIDRPWNNPFTDVSEGDWYYEAVRFVQERGLMNGYEDGRFGPNDNLSRAQLAQILFNKEGRPGVNYPLNFSDVASEAWHAEAIRWAASQGIVGGYGNGRFGPNDPITREQLAVMLWRYSGSPAAANKELHFNDTDEISPFALEAMRWAVENGVLSGYGNGRLGPQGQATRAEAAQMLKNFIENQEGKN